jgi:hypothetical protein
VAVLFKNKWQNELIKMKTYDKNKPLFSIHIPKAGGSSFQGILKKWFGPDVYFHYFNEIDNKMPEKYEPRSGICIHGHFNKKRDFGVQDYYPAASQFITFLRDPFEILISRYFFEKRRESINRSFRDGKALNLPGDINKYLDAEINKKDYHPNILDYMPVEVTLNNYRDVFAEYFIYIGIMEDYQFSVDRLAAKLNFPSQPVEHLNKSARFMDFSPEYREKFVELHPVECAFYSYVSNNYKK